MDETVKIVQALLEATYKDLDKVDINNIVKIIKIKIKDTKI